ncbi:patatin-like phospholipase domain-containing protein 4 isoform X5 [Pseudophryne corroboree]|uniref:patatin-like phospholipase domain-containing protein 4 isoform X5 n=1 Tax=Pseudophryne corroboree TaxID=495146 RepID=UPI00308123F2
MNHLNLSFAACGFLGIYHLGAASALLKHGGTMLKAVKVFAGASAGSLAATVLLTAPDKIKESKDFIYTFSEDVRKETLGAVTPRYDFMNRLREGIEAILPHKAHEIAENCLYISITNTKSRENCLVSSFASREELIKKWFDGGFTNGLPLLPTGRTVTVSPFCGRQDICPEDKGHVDLYFNIAMQDVLLSPANFERLRQALFPPSHAKMESIFQDGFEDAVKFLRSENWNSVDRI